MVNNDYPNLMRTFCKLQAQRIQAVKRLEELYALKEECLKNPRELVNALQRGESLDLPLAIDVVELPEIDWSKYNIDPVVTGDKPDTRKKTKNECKTTKAEVDDTGIVLVRGRVYDAGKSKFFNQLWTPAEQRKLEELLIKYPEENISSRRWAKIAKELGTRTVSQVQSRIQKYFSALKKEGLPIPGRSPRHGTYKWMGKRKKRRGRGTCSTFTKAFDFEGFPPPSPIHIKEISPRNESVGNNSLMPNSSVSDEEDVDDSVKHTTEYNEFIRLKTIRKKIQLLQSGSGFEL